MDDNYFTKIQELYLTYCHTKVSVHDVKVAKTLLHEWPSHFVLADKVYISKFLKADLKGHGIDLETSSRSNMKHNSKTDAIIKRLRLRVETTFSQLKAEFDIEHDRGITTKGYQTRFEQCLLVDTRMCIRCFFSSFLTNFQLV